MRFAALAIVIALGSTSEAPASELSNQISCVSGSVPAHDYAELGQNLNESAWDRYAGVSIVSSNSGLKLRVLDPAGNSICQETANNATSCTFQLGFASVEEFTIAIDNGNGAAPNMYKLCAF